MADQFFVVYQLQGYTEYNMLRHFEKLLRAFPYSKLSKGESVLRVSAVSFSEPALFEMSWQDPVRPSAVLAAIREHHGGDCASAIDTWWDLWQHDTEWKLTPTRAVLTCFGPRFEDREGDLRIEFGIDTHFLPQPELPNYLLMAQSNIRSLLHLVEDLERVLAVEKRRLETESGENLAEKLLAALPEVRA